jgi:hypothetical protein
LACFKIFFSRLQLFSITLIFRKASDMQCNINQQGRTARIIMGAFIESLGIAAGIWWFMGGPAWLIWPTIGCVAGGWFAIMEGILGWCAMRAMGFRTPL